MATRPNCCCVPDLKRQANDKQSAEDMKTLTDFLASEDQAASSAVPPPAEKARENAASKHATKHDARHVTLHHATFHDARQVSTQRHGLTPRHARPRRTALWLAEQRLAAQRQTALLPVPLECLLWQHTDEAAAEAVLGAGAAVLGAAIILKALLAAIVLRTDLDEGEDEGEAEAGTWRRRPTKKAIRRTRRNTSDLVFLPNHGMSSGRLTGRWWHFEALRCWCPRPLALTIEGSSCK